MDQMKKVRSSFLFRTFIIVIPILNIDNILNQFQLFCIHKLRLWLDGCLFVYDKTEWASFEQKLKALPLGNKEARNLVRFFLAGADEVELDKQGRILVAPPLREYAALEKDVTVIGVGNRVEIWNKDKYLDEATFDNMDEIAEQLQSIGFGI